MVRSTANETLRVFKDSYLDGLPVYKEWYNGGVGSKYDNIAPGVLAKLLNEDMAELSNETSAKKRKNNDKSKSKKKHKGKERATSEEIDDSD